MDFLEAIRDGRIVLTFDRDYGELIFRHKARNVPGVVHFRFTPALPDEAGKILSDTLKERRVALAGKFTAPAATPKTPTAPSPAGAASV